MNYWANPPMCQRRQNPGKSPPRKKPDDIPGAALDRVRSQLRRDALKVKEPTVNESQQFTIKITSCN